MGFMDTIKDKLAGQGMPTSGMLHGLASGLLDHLTPNGQVPSGGISKEQILSAAMNLFRHDQ